MSDGTAMGMPQQHGDTTLALRRPPGDARGARPAMPDGPDMLDRRGAADGAAGTFPPVGREAVDHRRMFDILVAAAALLASLPVLLFACAAIALTMHRDVLLLQTRHGRHGRPFTLIRLRAQQDAGAAEHAQGRLTPVGRTLRRFGIDALPEFLNVLAGDMAIFGPRPWACEPPVEGWTTRSAVAPGLIGLASIREKVAGVRSPPRRVVADDLEYIRRRTWRMDAWLLILAGACTLAGRIDPQEPSMPDGRVATALRRLAAATIG